MRKPVRTLAVALSLPLIAGCFATVVTPIPPTPSQREALGVRGVVERSGERVEFREIFDVSWTNDQLFIVGQRDDGNGVQSVTRQWPLAGLEGVLERKIDPGKTSGVIGGVVIGTIVTFALLVTGSDPRVN